MSEISRAPSGLAFADDGSLVPFTEFDYEQAERDLFGAVAANGDDGELDCEELQRALKFIRALFEWIYGNGMQNPEGLNVRAMIVCWRLLEYLHPLTLAELARGYGQEKRSIGRWLQDFNAKFPHLRNVDRAPPEAEMPAAVPVAVESSGISLGTSAPLISSHNRRLIEQVGSKGG
jgi:hypothetical protein